MSTEKCHFCGYHYNAEELLSKCGRCPMKTSHSGAGMSCCPNCGIEVKMRSSVVDFLSAVTARLKAGKH